MSEKRFSWVKDLIDTDAKAFGTYVALLYLRFDWYYHDFASAPSMESYDYSSFESRMREILKLYLIGRDKYDAFEAARTFFNKMFAHHGSEALKASTRNRLLEQIEAEFFETFVKAYRKYLKLDEIPYEFRKRIALFLRKVRSREISVSLETISESVEVSDYSISGFLKSLNLKEDEVKAFYQYLVNSGIAIYRGYGDYIIPVPCLLDDVLKVLEEGVKEVKAVEARVREVEVVPSKYAGVKPSREILEGIVAEALKNLGFTVQTDVKLPAKGGDIEVDVWGVKSIGGAQFRVYVSCKNWDKDVDRTVVDHEFGRVLQLYQLPHLRILVVKSLTEPARKAAFDDGFFVIELGEKASTENAQEIYDIVYNKLKEIFIGIAPEKIMKAIERLKEAMKLLEEVM
jgi:hypothetical protein